MSRLKLLHRADEIGRERALEAGFDDYLAKPFTLEQFERMLAIWLERGATAGNEPG